MIHIMSHLQILCVFGNSTLRYNGLIYLQQLVMFDQGFMEIQTVLQFHSWSIINEHPLETFVLAIQVQDKTG